MGQGRIIKVELIDLLPDAKLNRFDGTCLNLPKLPIGFHLKAEWDLIPTITSPAKPQQSVSWIKTLV